MKKVMIDLDETICTGGYLEVLNKYLKTNYKADDVKDYYVESLIPEEKRDEYLDYFYQNINVYDYVTILPNAIEVIKKLTQIYDVYICSAYVDMRRPYESAIVATLKHQWISKNLPFIHPRKIILTGSKDLIQCDIKIDDKFSNLKGYGEIKLLIDNNHNKKYSDIELKERNVKRVKDWLEIEKILLSEEIEQL